MEDRKGLYRVLVARPEVKRPHRRLVAYSTIIS
jgi:hypothetical protein